jgi:bacteriorhodopsin
MTPALTPHDIVGTTFYIACNMMLAFTGFFFFQVYQVPRKWSTSVSISCLVTGIAWYNYTFMRDIWVAEQTTPTVYRYTDWLITVPLLILEFFLILKASGEATTALGLRLFGAALLMLAFGWVAEIDVLDKVSGFIFSMLAWIYIIFEIFLGEAASCAENIKSDAAKKAFAWMRIVVSVGWAIYPIGYMEGYFSNAMGSAKEQAYVNIIYNVADLINKGGFGLIVWSVAVSDTEA